MLDEAEEERDGGGGGGRLCRGGGVLRRAYDDDDGVGVGVEAFGLLRVGGWNRFKASENDVVIVKSRMKRAVCASLLVMVMCCQY